MDVTREIYWNIVYGALIYGFLIAALACLGYGVLQRFKLWRLGGEAARFDRIPERLSGLLAEIFGQRRQLRDPIPGHAHLLIFYGFFVSLVATSLISIQEWTGIHYLQGTFYKWYSLISDLGGVIGLVGLAIVIWRRGVTRPERLHSAVNDWIALALLTLIFAQGFLVEGLRIAATELAQQPELARWSPGGFVVAQLLSGLSEATLRALHRYAWWFHAVTAFAFIGYMAYGKFGHILFGIANVFFRNLEPSGKLGYPDI